MPCSDGGVPWPPSATEVAEQKFARRAPGLLCSACRALERLGYDFDENPELSDWWAIHKKEDDARIEAELLAAQKVNWEKNIIREATAKPFGELSKEELDLLRKYKFI